MLWIPLITCMLNLVLLGLIFSTFFFGLLTLDASVLEDDSAMVPFMYLFAFCCYVVGAFTLAISQAGIAHIVYTRIKGGDATLGQGLSVAFSHTGSLLLWSLITSTVGLILRIIADRSKLLGNIIAGLFGAAWQILTYFVVPAMIIDRHSAFRSIGTSVRVFKQTWGETIVTNISIGLIFLAAHIVVFGAFLGLVVATLALEVPGLLFLLFGLLLIWFIFASLVQSALNGVLKTLLYVYASEHIVPENFNRELLDAMLVRQRPTIPPPIPTNSNPPITD